MNTQELVSGYDIYTTVEELSAVTSAAPANGDSLESIGTPSPLCPGPCWPTLFVCV
jgi:hypothetical protein